MAIYPTRTLKWISPACLWCILISASWTQELPTEYGGIEIGSEGVKSIVGTMTRDGFASVPNQEQSRNLGLVGALDNKSNSPPQFDEEALRSLGETLDEFIKGFQNRNIPASRVFVAVSSGLAGQAGTQTGEINATLRPLADIVRDRIGHDITIVTPAEEARWTFNGTVQQEGLRSSTLVIDVGAGNSKFATQAEQVGFPLGARTFAAQSTGQDLQELRATAHQQLRQAIDQLDLTKIQRVYVTGGSAYIASVISLPREIAKNPRSLHDLGTGKSLGLTKVLDQLEGKRLIAEVFDPLIAQHADEATRAQLTKAKGIYDLERLRCGITLLEQSIAIVQASHPNDRISVEFYGDGQVAWMKGFMQEKLKPTPPDPDPARQTSLDAVGEEIRLLRQHLEKNVPGQNIIPPDFANLPTTSDIASLRGDIHQLESSLKAGLSEIAASIRQARIPSSPNTGGGGGQVASKAAAPVRLRKLSEQHYWEGFKSYRKGQMLAAREASQRAIAAWPQNKLAWYLLIVTDVTLGDDANAEFASQQFVQLVGDDDSQHNEIARAFERIQGPPRLRAERLILLAREALAAPRPYELSLSK